MKGRRCVPLSAPCTAVHGVHPAASCRVERIVLAASEPTTNSQMPAPSVAPNSPAPLRNPCPAAKSGGASDADHVFVAGAYTAASTPVPPAFLRNACTSADVTATRAQSF